MRALAASFQSAPASEDTAVTAAASIAAMKPQKQNRLIPTEFIVDALSFRSRFIRRLST